MDDVCADEAGADGFVQRASLIMRAPNGGPGRENSLLQGILQGTWWTCVALFLVREPKCIERQGLSAGDC